MPDRTIRVEGEAWRAVALLQQSSAAHKDAVRFAREASRLLGLAPGEQVESYSVDDGTIAIRSTDERTE